MYSHKEKYRSPHACKTHLIMERELYFLPRCILSLTLVNPEFVEILNEVEIIYSAYLTMSFQSLHIYFRSSKKSYFCK